MESDQPRPALAVRELTRHYGRVRVLDKLTLTVSAGAIHGLVGLNGAGKTTALESILGMLPVGSGQITLLGRHPTDLWRSGGAVTAVFDNAALHPGLTVRQTLQHARLLSSRPARPPEELERLLGLVRYRDYRIRELSLGNRRRAAIAQALVNRPEFLLLDEPFNGLDAGGVDDVLALIDRLNREDGTTFLLSSHQLAYLERVCSHLSILHHGQIVTSGRVEDMLADRSSHLYLRCDDIAAAMDLLGKRPGVQSVGQPDGQYLKIVIEPGCDSADINRLLLEGGVNVSELYREQASLESLFRSVTAGGEAAA